MGFPNPVAEITIKTTAIDDLVLKTALTTTQPSAIQRFLLKATPCGYLEARAPSSPTAAHSPLPVEPEE